MQEPHAEVLFEEGNLARNGSLADVPLTRHSGKRTGFRRAHQRSQSAYDIHRSVRSIWSIGTGVPLSDGTRSVFRATVFSFV
jgi:hypothetical protein